ncbi:O-antigen ligase family protein [Candidatus Chloroploca sp. M-50]|uniref:O-antigen ligase family protein n=1 Tax=Candidatus Chloroploca mongolica TaxID=2528176 RepID=A0ABS4DCI5_9CHLR|nr:O-antigen ligase family protein [Candidatus Chloroploca mongolica]MBP1467167.1 O-antigen ligase family protein [Candidatus Chloroploca mongolica]
MKIHHSFRLVALLLLNGLLLVSFAGFVWADNALHRGVVFTPDPEPIPQADGPTLGINLFNVHLEPDPVAVQRSFELSAELGARFVRMQVPWDDLEIHGRGDFEDRRNVEAIGVVSSWAKYDRIAHAARAAGIELIWRLERPPVWARRQFEADPVFQAGLLVDGNSTGPPDDLADYAAFVRAVVERYNGNGVDDAPGSPVVRYFQIWNEPNLRNEWNWHDPRPEDFVELLRVGATAVRETNPDAVVIFPGLAPTDGLDFRAPMTELEYLDRVYRAGGAAYFDVMAAQGYGLGQSPDEHRYVFLRGRGNWNWQRPIDTRNDVSRVVLLREVMERHGDHATPIWITEFGWNSAPDHIPPERRMTWGPPVSETTKGEYLVGQMERARDEWPWIGVMNVWMLRYGGYAEPDPADPTPYFALVSRDWQIQPSFDILQAFATAPAIAGVGAHSWNHAAVAPLADGWRLQFAGTRIALVVDQANPVAVTINGDPVALRHAESDGRSLLVSDELPDSVHVLELQGPRAPVSFIVERSRRWAFWWDYGALGLLALMAVSGAATMLAAPPVLVLMSQRVRRLRGQMLARGGWLAYLVQTDTLVASGMLFAVIIAYRASPQVPLTLAGLLLFAILAVMRPRVALLFVPLTLPLYFIPKLIFDSRFGLRESGLALPLHELLLVIALFAAGVRLVIEVMAHWLKRPLREPQVLALPGNAMCALRDRRQTWSFWLPILLVGLAAVWGVVIAEQRGPALRELRWMFVGPMVFVGVAALFGQAYQRPVVLAWLTGGALAGLVGLLQFGGLNLVPLFGTKAGFGDDSFFVEGVRRVASLYGHPNNLGLAMGRYWPVAAALTFVALRAGGVRRAWPYALVTLLTLGGLLVSFSRGAYLGMLVASGVLALALVPAKLWRTRRVLVPLAIVAGIGVVGVILVIILDIERLNPFGASSGVRVQTWLSALAMWRDHPLGIGLDQFGRLYPAYINPALAATNEINTAHPHNLLLDLALRMGPLGLLAFGWLLFNFARGAWQTLARTGAARHAGAYGPVLVAGVSAAMAGGLLHGMVDQFYFWPDLAFAFWLMVWVEYVHR